MELTDTSPANSEAANLFRENTKEYERRVKVSHDSTYSPLVVNRLKLMPGRRRWSIHGSTIPRS